jgi:hypothetical protein
VRRTATVALRKCSTCNSNRLACGSAESPRPGPIAGSDLRWRWPAQLVTTAGENGLSISARRLKLLCALHESGSGTADVDGLPINVRFRVARLEMLTVERP